MSEREDQVFKDSLGKLKGIFQREKESRMSTGHSLYDIGGLTNEDLEKVQKASDNNNNIEISDGRVFKLNVVNGYVVGFDIDKKKIFK